MEDLLLLKYPAKAGKITALRGMGVGDDEIESAMRERVQGLLSQGVSQAEVNDALGFTETQRARLNEAHKNNAFEFIGRAWDYGHGKPDELFQIAEDKRIPVTTLLHKPEMLQAIKAKETGPLHERPTFEAVMAQNPGMARLNSPVYRTVGGVASGFLASEATFWRGVEWMTHWDKAKEWGDSLMDMSTSVSKSVLEGNDPNLWDATLQGLGSTAFFLIPGMIAGYGVGATSAITGAVLGLKEKAVMSMSKWLGAGVSGSMEGLAEAGDVYRTILDATGDEGAATMAASKTFWTNLPLNVVLDKLAFFDDNPMMKKWFMKMLPEKTAGVMGGVTGRFLKEGLQETLQGGIQEQALTGKSWADLDWLNLAVTQGLPGGLAASVFGMAMGHQSALSPAETPQQATERQGAVKEIFQTIRDAAVSAGHYEDAATGAAAITASFYNTMSKRYGVNAGELFKRRNLQIQQGVTATEGLVLNQAEVETPEFKAWFGDSKVVDEQGKPLVVYHGSLGTFDEFKEMPTRPGNRDSFGKGFYFTSQKSTADVFGDGPKKRGNGAKVYSVYLSVKKPLTTGTIDADALIKAKNAERVGQGYPLLSDQEQNGIKEGINEAVSSVGYNENELLETVISVFGRKAIESAGYDGIIYGGQTGTDEIVVFSPTQIKSIDNEGTFDPNNPNIYKQGEAVPGDMVLKQSGKPSKKFKTFFGKSRAKGQSGEPRIFYHGNPSGNKPKTFQPNEDGQIYFASDPELAETYAGLSSRANDIVYGHAISRVYLKMENPLDLYKLERDPNYLPEITDDVVEDWEFPEEQIRDIRNIQKNPGITEKLKAMGFDSVIGVGRDPKNPNEVVTEYVVFSPEQVWSIEHEGFYDGSRPGLDGEDDDKGSSKTDAQYLAAIKRGDMETAQRIIDEAAAASGLPILDDKDIFHQTDRGQINLSNGEAVVSLFKTADRSTLIHEMSHLMLEEIRTMALSEDAPDGLKRDWAVLSNWMGVTAETDITTEAHETFARGMEAYLMEGTPPSPALRGVFETFRKWLVDIYRNVKALNVEMNDEVRSIFDRLLATDDEIEAEAMQTAEATVTEEDDAPETPPEQADRKMVDALIDEDEAVMFDPSWFDEEGTEEGREEVDTMLQGQEQFALEQENMRQWRGLLNAVRNLGGVAYESVRTAFGPESAQELWRVAGNIFRANGESFDKMAQLLQESGYPVQDWNDLYNRLMTRPKTPEAPPIAPVNAETMPWLLDRLGVGGALKYVNRRLRMLEKEVSSLTADLDRVKNEGANPDDLIAVRDSLQLRYKELEYVKEQSKGLKASAKAEEGKGKAGKVAEAPLTMIEALQLAKQGAVTWTHETVKDAIERVTGKTKIGDLMEEDRALREALKMAKRTARLAYRAGMDEGRESVQPELDRAKGELKVERIKHKDTWDYVGEVRKEGVRIGKRLGYIEARMKVKALQERIRERNEEKKMIAKMVHEIDHAMDGNIRVTQKEEIRELLEGYDLKRRNKETLAIRREMEAFFREHPEAIPEASAKDVYYIGRRTLSEMEIDDLGELHEKVMAIREEGKKAYALWEAERKERVDTWRQSLINVMGGRKRRKGDRVNGKLTQEETLRLKAAENTWIPDSVFRFMEGSTKGDGAFSKVFMKTANEAEDAKLRMLHRRHERMSKALEALGFKGGLEDPHWYQERIKDTDPETGEEVTWTVDGLLNLYIGWQNPRYRDALRYGMNITPERYETLTGKLSDDEKKAGVLVARDHALERDELNKVFEDAYNLHLAEEPNYIRLYRDTFEADKKLLDNNDAELADDLMFQVNGAQKFYTSRGFTFERKDIPPEMQAKVPPKLGLFSNWLSAVEEEAHWVGYGGLVRDLQALLGERWHPELPSFKESIEARWGRETFDFLQDYVNRLSRSHFYHGYTALDAGARKLRGNMGLAYLSFNVMTIIKQPTVLALTMGRAGLPQTLMSLARFTANPKETLQRVWELDPQVKEQSMDRFIEELKRTVKPDVIKRLGKVGFKPIMWLDMFARVVGWEAVYRDELAKLRKQGMSPEEAHERAREEAQRFTLRVNNAASPKDIPRYMAHDEILNLITVFTNQANKVWSLATYDVPFSFKEGKWVEGFSTACGLLLMGFLTSLVSKGRPPEDPKEALAWASSEVAQSIPLFGKPLVSQLQGFHGGTTPIDTMARDAGKLIVNISKGKVADLDNAGLILETYALARGVPYMPLKRVLKAAKDGNPMALLGFMRQEKKRRKVAMY